MKLYLINQNTHLPNLIGKIQVKNILFAALSASEKFQESFNKIKSAVMDVGIAFLPIIDSIIL